MKRILLLVSLFLISGVARADFMFDLSVGYLAQTSQNFKRSTMEGHFFIGYGLGGKEQFYVGPNFTSTEDDINASSTTEIGARFEYYLNSDKNFKITGAYNPFVTAKVGGVDTDASSFLAGLGYELKVNANLHVGATLMYHKVNAEVESSGEDLGYNTTIPMITAVLRFK